MQRVAQLPDGLLSALLCEVLKQETFQYQPGFGEGKTHTPLREEAMESLVFLPEVTNYKPFFILKVLRVFPFLPEIGDIACGPGDPGEPALLTCLPPTLQTVSKDVTPALGEHSQT